MCVFGDLYPFVAAEVYICAKIVYMWISIIDGNVQPEGYNSLLDACVYAWLSYNSAKKGILKRGRVELVSVNVNKVKGKKRHSFSGDIEQTRMKGWRDDISMVEV